MYRGASRAFVNTATVIRERTHLQSFVQRHRVASTSPESRNYLPLTCGPRVSAGIPSTTPIASTFRLNRAASAGSVLDNRTRVNARPRIPPPTQSTHESNRTNVISRNPEYVMCSCDVCRQTGLWTSSVAAARGSQGPLEAAACLHQHQPRAFVVRALGSFDQDSG